MQRRILLALPLAVWTAPARASLQPPELMQALPQARLQGEARMRFLGFEVYDIRLWAPQPIGPENWTDAPLALALTYARSLDGAAIAERSIEEMRRQGPIDDTQAARWLDAMKRLFPDVGNGDRLTGIHRPAVGAAFYYNGQARGEVADTTFARRFFGIWLSPQTSEPSLRNRLLGTGK